jgi:acyl CoA:acetate/3-ketoacid CoA transferase
MRKHISFEEAAGLIRDGDVVVVSSASGVACPDKMLAALGERYEREGHPRGLTTLHPIATGDVYGLKGIDHLARHTGMLARVLAGSYPSAPSSLPMPAIWRRIIDDEIAAYNLPSGVLFDMLRDAAAKKPGPLTQVGLDTFIDPRREGGAMNARAARAPVVERLDFAEREWLHFPAIAPRVAIIRATSADERGNLSYEHEGAFLGAHDVALAAHNNGGIVIAQVKRIVKSGTIKPQNVFVPSTLVDHIVVDPEQWQATQTPYDPAVSGEIACPDASFELQAWGPEKVIARRAAQELKAGMVVNLGFGISANVPRILLEEGQFDAVTCVIEQGAVGGMPLLGFAFGCSANAEAIVPSPQQFVYFQGGGFDLSLLSFMQIDRAGSVNVSKLVARPYLTSGVGGFVDITTHARRIVYSGLYTAGAKLEAGGGRLNILKEGKIKLVDAVEQVSFSGNMARRRGQAIRYITERCVLDLAEDGLIVREIAPGAELERDILALAAFPLKVDPQLKTMDAALFHDRLMGLSLAEKSE